MPSRRNVDGNAQRLAGFCELRESISGSKKDSEQSQPDSSRLPSLQEGLYEIRRTGHDAFFISQIQKDVDFSGRNRKFIDRSYQIPGQVIDLREEIDSWGAEKFRWTIENTVSDARVRVNGFVEGRQTRPFGPREVAITEAG